MQSFLNFTNGLTSQENLLWAVTWSLIVGRYCRNWHERNYVQMAYKRLGPKPWVPVSSKVLQPTIAAEVRNSSGRVREFTLQAINALCDKGFGHANYILCAQLLQTDCEYCASLQTSILYITSIQTFMYTHKRCVKCHSSECFESWISKSGKFLL